MIFWTTVASALLFFLLMQAAFWFVRARRAEHAAAMLGRVYGDAKVENVGFRPQRLASKEILQEILGASPLAHRLAALLEQSGLSMTVSTLLGQMFLGLLTGAVGGVALRVPMESMLVLGLGGAAVPLAFVLYKRSARAAAFERQFPQALEMIVMFLKAGRSLPQAVAGAAGELASPVADELDTVSEEYRLGRTVDAALKKLVAKYPLSGGLRAFVVAVSVLGQAGGNLVEIIERIRGALEAEMQYTRKLRALTGETRMSALVLGALPGVFLFISATLNPDYFKLLIDEPMGHAILMVCLALWAAGVLWIRKLMQSRPV